MLCEIERKGDSGRDTEREGGEEEGERVSHVERQKESICECVCVRERERQTEREREIKKEFILEEFLCFL